MISVSGAFSVTFSVIFAYIADVTNERERSTAYGLVRGSFIKHENHFGQSLRSQWSCFRIFLLHDLDSVSLTQLDRWVLFLSASRFLRHSQRVWSPAQPSAHTCRPATAIIWWCCWRLSSLWPTSASSCWPSQSRCLRRWGSTHGERPSPGSRLTRSL